MRAFIVALFALIVFGAISCKKGLVSPSVEITGKWRWVKSVGGIGGFTLTPQSTGNNFRDEFYADSSYKRFENDSLIIQGKFSIIRNFNYTASDKIDVLKIGDFKRSIFIHNDTLYLNDLYIADGYGDTYVRIK